MLLAGSHTLHEITDCSGAKPASPKAALSSIIKAFPMFIPMDRSAMTETRLLLKARLHWLPVHRSCLRRVLFKYHEESTSW